MVDGTDIPPACATARACPDEALAGPLCTETINPKLARIIRQKLRAARKKADKAAASSATKAAKLGRRARKLVRGVDTQAGKFVTKKKNPISADCRGRIGSALGSVLEHLEGNRV